ncbi:type ISP restriction/modification enzyme [Wielerella bovis]|uniref:type ISP restriction/modification enzyme n=1 Tax=Wielerella bovis TaxID=2917790 RepID=UPI0020186D72|nr:type ISP restriction/modification enzyme [Wielerella bovis]MCG7656935.1 N-6 DNA methylase [Wielerella bovis]MCG7659158.1 N-6 DNA methylase [Wielerella bovis]
MPIKNYLQECHTLFNSGKATEHSYRPALQKLIAQLAPEIQVTNEPKRIACGAPDYILTRNDLPIGYIEAKDINVDLHHKTLQEQFARYKSALDNLIITDYLQFEFYRDGKRIAHIRLADFSTKKMEIYHEEFEKFTQLIQTFAQHQGQKINSPSVLAEMMANKARMMADVIEKALEQDAKSDGISELESYLEGFREHLLHDLTEKKFADLYAQTLAYGMFAARLHDDTPETFSRHEAARLLPKSNPFLRALFQKLGEENLDTRIVWIVDALADIFRVADVPKILQDFGKNKLTDDPFIHFYETFLEKYDPKIREENGVWYTPQPAVQFIVKAIDQALKTHLGIKQGLRDNSKTEIAVETTAKKQAKGGGYKRIMTDKEIHRVQILDPATGTGTFLAEIVRHIYAQFGKQKGLWQNYVPTDLIPRLSGFELMMASYAMAHLKLDLVLQETDFRLPENSKQRLNVFLTDTLEEHHPDTNTLFAQWLSNEANSANAIKRDNPIMVVVGNPPYFGESKNKGEWIMGLMDDYKREPNTDQKLKERNSKWINNDYVKFLRYAQHHIEKTKQGVIGFINMNSYLDGVIFRGVRWNMLQTYDQIYILDLHGNSKKQETAPDGSKDDNVFDITEGVCINIFVKTGEKKKKGELAKVYHADLFGKRADKFTFLQNYDLNTVSWTELQPSAPDYFFVPKSYNADELADYHKMIDLMELFPINSVGIVTARDDLCIQASKERMKNILDEFVNLETESARTRFNLGKDVRDWNVADAQTDVKNHLETHQIVPIAYRPFDTRYTFFTGNSKGFHCMPRGNVMKHFVGKINLGLCLTKQFKSGSTYQHCLISETIMESGYVSNKTSEITSIFPLYVYPDNQSLNFSGSLQRQPNINETIVKKIAKIIKKDWGSDDFTPENLLDYIYAVLHSPNYRTKYAEMLKTNFPRIPYPENASEFFRLADLGKELRLWHTLKHDDCDMANFITEFNAENPDMTVDKPKYENETVFWNKTGSLKGVPQAVWEMYIGGYQPAQKWLKDRKGQTLTAADLEHYQKMILALSKTLEIMQQIDK